MRGRALAMFGLAVGTAGSATTDAGTPPTAPVVSPAPGGSVRLPDVLSITKAKLDPEATRTIGTCDPAMTAKGSARFGLAHVNDLQARYSERLAGKSRYAYVAGYLKLLKTAQPTLVLDAGDDYEKGSIAELRSNGETTRQVVQAMPFDVRVIGNHDFAYGENVVLRDVRLSQHPVLAANIKHPGFTPAKQPFRPYARFDVGCVKVGVIGLVTQNFGADDQPTNAPFDDVFQQDPHYSAILDREAKAHRSEVDVLIALTHLGYAEDLALARKGGKLVDFIVGGHTEDTIRDPGVVVQPGGAKTYIVQAGHFGEKVGHGDVVVDLKTPRKIGFEKYKMIEIDEKTPGPLDAIDDLVNSLEAAVAPDTNKPIGKTKQEIKTGHPMMELLYRATKETWNLDVLIAGKDQFWAGLPKGDVTLQRLYDTVLVQKEPTGTNGFSSIWVQDMNGDDLSALFRSFQPAGKYEWSGLTHFDPKKTYKIGFDKRAAIYPRPLFGMAAKAVHAAFVGEMIDALEPFVRNRTAKGLTID